jgi:Tol biopolymer transport system component
MNANRMPESPLESWKEIAKYLQRDITTAQRWEKEEALPVHRHSHKSRSSVYAYPSEIDAWRGSRKVVPEPAPPRPLWKIPAFALMMLLCLVTVGNGVRPVSAQQRGAGKMNQQVWVTGNERPNSISADGRYMGFTDYSTGDLGIRDLKTGKSRRLTNTGGWAKDRDFAEFPVISPDGRQIAYAWWGNGTKAEVKVIQTEGGHPKTIWQANSENLIPESWTADSKQLLVLHSPPTGDNKLAMLSLQDGSLRAIKSFKRQVLYATLSPDGRWIACDPQADEKTTAKDILVLAVDGSREINAVQHPANDSSPVWSPDGSQIFFRSDRTGQDALWSVSFENGKIGDPQLVKADLPRVRSNLQNMWMTRDGTLYYFSVGQFISNVYVADLDANGKVSRPPVLAVERLANKNGFPALSWDGQDMAFARGGNFVIYGPRSEELVIHTLKTGEERIVPSEVPLRGTPKWFPGGRSILITSPLPGKGSTLYRVDRSTGTADPLHTAAGPVRVFDLSSDGKTIFYVQALCERFICPDPPHARLVRFDIALGRETELKKGDIWSVAVSPDGKQVAFLDQGGFISVMPEVGEAREVYRGAPWIANYMQPLAWSPDQHYLIFTHDESLLRVPISGGPVEQMGLSMPGIQSLSVQPDGRRMYFSANSPDEVWSLANLLPKTVTPAK